MTSLLSVLSAKHTFSIMPFMERPRSSPGNNLGRRALITNAAAAAMAGQAGAADAPLRIGYMRWPDRQPTISLLDKPAPDAGLAGARLAIADNNTTGQFIGQQFELVDAYSLDGIAEQGVVLILTDAPAEPLLKMAVQAQSQGITLFNIASPDDALRQEILSRQHYPRGAIPSDAS